MFLRRFLSTAAPKAAAEMVTCKEVSPAIGPYSSAVRAGGFLFVSGQLPTVPATGEFVHPTDVAQQADQCLKNMGAILASGGSSYSKVVKATVFLVDMADFGRVNEVYARYFSSWKPARACIAVRELPKGARVEIECVATVE